jgi:hypothetical protein
LKAAREDSAQTKRLVAVTVSDTKEGRMSEQDRVDTPEHDDVEAHKHHMTDDPDAGTESEDVEAHGHHTAAWQDSDAEEGKNSAAWQESDVEAHGRTAAASEDPDSSDSDDFEAHSKHTA